MLTPYIADVENWPAFTRYLPMCSATWARHLPSFPYRSCTTDTLLRSRGVQRLDDLIISFFAVD